MSGDGGQPDVAPPSRDEGSDDGGVRPVGPMAIKPIALPQLPRHHRHATDGEVDETGSDGSSDGETARVVPAPLLAPLASGTKPPAAAAVVGSMVLEDDESSSGDGRPSPPPPPYSDIDPRAGSDITGMGGAVDQPGIPETQDAVVTGDDNVTAEVVAAAESNPNSANHLGAIADAPVELNGSDGATTASVTILRSGGDPPPPERNNEDGDLASPALVSDADDGTDGVDSADGVKGVAVAIPEALVAVAMTADDGLVADGEDVNKGGDDLLFTPIMPTQHVAMEPVEVAAGTKPAVVGPGSAAKPSMYTVVTESDGSYSGMAPGVRGEVPFFLSYPILFFLSANHQQHPGTSIFGPADDDGSGEGGLDLDDIDLFGGGDDDEAVSALGL